MDHPSNATVEARPRPLPARPRTSHGAAPTTDLETLVERRVALLTSLASIYADHGRRLDRDPLDRRADRRGADALEERANAAEAELEEIENRLAEACAAGLRPRR